MNEAYISKFLTGNFSIVTTHSAVGALPSLWAPLADGDQTRRIAAFEMLADQVFSLMPETLATLGETTKDAYLVKLDIDLMLVVDRLLDGDMVSYRGFLPRAASRFGGSIGKFYNLMDGFCDFHSMGGLLPERDIRPIGRDGNEYLTEPSLSEFNNHKSKDYLNVFNSGGKGQGYVSLSSTFGENPDAMLLWVDDDEPLVGMDFWDLFDSWTAIAMSND
ncbi:hypothetical protein [Rhizobium tumorigenes]|uniref:SMI1/KNR4 family protein n=1 Tax=Rhizobium tumorigenes TaxID=2041385 RepID=A0AAF1KW11_9HYPH|nr:hypothetical protein [Rhizobium tumorigenes]WFR97541.1 hypothetical protein PR017_20195 [Rhizobium tumorigenes]WFS03142.1 hypothetical protein PR016_20940 [Rhizobium tumorigenes]